MRKLICLLVLAVVVAVGTGCAGKVTTEFVRPEEHPIMESKVYNYPYEKVWKAVVQSIGSSYFVLENIEKDSGILSLSFAAQNPGDFVDCGVVKEHGTVVMRAYDNTFAGTASNIQRKFVTDQGVPGEMIRSCSLSGKANVLVQSLGPKQTRVTIRTRYVFTLTNMVMPYGAPAPVKMEATMNFTGSEVGTFPDTNKLQSLQCRSRGTLEISILDGIEKGL